MAVCVHRPLWEVNKRKTIAATEMNNDTYCLQKLIEKFPLQWNFRQHAKLTRNSNRKKPTLPKNEIKGKK